MASTSCWDCEVVAHMTPVDGSASVRSGRLRKRVMGCFRCDNCGALNIAIANKWVEDVDPLVWLAGKRNNTFVEWQPQPAEEEPSWDFPDVPSEIADAADEAYRCWYHDANRAAVIMARAVIEATAKDMDIVKGNLLDKIDEMLKQGLIRPGVRDGAHEVRHFGNDTAHGDFVAAITDEEAKLVLTLMSEVLNEVYQAPARVAEAKAAREERARRAQIGATSSQVTPAAMEALQAFMKAKDIRVQAIPLPPTTTGQGGSGQGSAN
jgi:Domain of unknown function (DUF4145)